MAIKVDISNRAVETTKSVILPGGAGMEMVWIQPGMFLMGAESSEPGQHSNENPRHEVTISQGFYLGRYVVTQRQWASVMGTCPWVLEDNVCDDPDHPAVYVSWEDAQEFMGKLNAAEGTDVYRLPTEAEWEYACRAGTTSRWSFGDDENRLRDHAWYWDNASYAGERYAHAAGTKLPNPWGLYDMHGNVNEWVQDWYGPYTRDGQTDPVGSDSGPGRVFRGGSFGAPGGWVRSTSRSFSWSSCCDSVIGFRVLKGMHYEFRREGNLQGSAQLFARVSQRLCPMGRYISHIVKQVFGG